MASGNINNLIPNSERTPEELREITRKGGIASGEARRKKKTMRETLKMCLEMTNKNGQSYRELATLGLIKGAMKGNAQNYRTMLETLGELKTGGNDNDINSQILNIANLLNNPQKNRSDKDVE